MFTHKILRKSGSWPAKLQRALPVGHLWSQANRRVWSLSCWILLLSTVSYRKYMF